jgi:hypothetical protein
MGLALVPRIAHADPVITGLSVNQGDLGSNLSIFGSGFGDTMGQSYVLLADQQLPVLSWTEPVITVFLMPRDANAVQRNVPLELVVVQQPGNKRSNTFEFTVTGPEVPTTPGDGTGTTTGGTTGDSTSATADRQALNDALLVERVAAEFFNQNITKPYLTTSVTTPGTTTGGTTTPDTTTGTTTGGATTSGTTGGATTGTTTGTTAGTTTGTTGTTAGTTTGTTAGTAGPFQDTTPAATNVNALRSMAEEMRANHQAHAQQLEQALGTNAQPVPSFRNLDAPTLSSAHTGLIATVQDRTFLATVAGILAVDARHAGAIRAYRKVVSTAEGGDPNLVVSPNGPAEQPLTREQILAFAQQYLGEATTTPGNGTGTGGTGTGTGSL